jgi:hypothetical protein
MNNMPKIQYSEHQAAAMLGVSVEELRTLVREHILKEDDVSGASLSTYQPSDVVLLRVLARMPRPAQVARS